MSTQKILSLEEIENVDKDFACAVKRGSATGVFIENRSLRALLATARAYHELMERVRDAVAKENSMDNELQKHWTKFLR